MCCDFVFRTGRYAYGLWTAVRCAAWPGVPATLMLWAPSPAPGNIPSATPVSWHSCQHRPVQKRWDLRNELPSLCVFLSRMKASFIVSGSQDCTVKVWDLPADLTTTGADIHQLTARITEKAHDKVRTQNSFQEEEKAFNRAAKSTTQFDTLHVFREALLSRF